MLYSSGTTGRPKGVKHALRDVPFGTAEGLTDLLALVLGADESTFEEGETMGVSQANTARWDTSSEGTEAMFSNIGQATSSYRAMNPAQRRTASERFLDDEEGSET